jgi:hypothetical protein
MRAMVSSFDHWRDEFMEREVDANEAALLARCDVSAIHRDIESGRLADRRPQGRGKHSVLVRELAEIRGLRPSVTEQTTAIAKADVEQLAARLLRGEANNRNRRAA